MSRVFLPYEACSDAIEAAADIVRHRGEPVDNVMVAAELEFRGMLDHIGRANVMRWFEENA